MTSLRQRRAVLPCALAVAVAASLLVASDWSPLSAEQSLASAGQTRAPNRPNVVVIMLDDARVDDLPYMPVTQRRMVNQGVEFSRAYAPFALCCPSRASFLTGQYAHNHGVLGNKAPGGGFKRFRDEQTLATWLDPSYTTAWVGKYLNQYGRATRTKRYIPPGWDNWKVPVKGVYNYRRHTLNQNGRTVSHAGTYSTKLYGKLTRRFITKHHDDSRPFFLVTSYLAPHNGKPLERNDSARRTPFVQPKYRNTYTGPSPVTNPAFNEADVRDKRPSIKNNPLLTRQQISHHVEANAQRRESLRSVDDQVGRTIDRLRSTGELANTYVILLSDNGVMLGEHRINAGKGLPYDAASHIPMVVRGPGIAPGSVDAMAGIHDLAPTILAMTRNRRARGTFPIDGMNLLRIIDNPRVGDHRSLKVEAGDGAGGYAFHGIIRRSGWKYVQFWTDGANEVEMYNLRSDPYELHNLADDPAFDAQQAKLDEVLLQLAFCSEQACRSN